MRERLRLAWATLGSAPWRRAPLVVRSHPGVAMTALGAVAVLAASLAAVPLFLSSVASASIELQAAERCGRDTGATRVAEVPVEELVRGRRDPFAPVSAQLGPTTSWARIELLSLAPSAGGQRVQASLLRTDRAADHVDLLEAGPDRGAGGVWITDRAADRTGLGVGDRTDLNGVPVTVTGIYRDLSGAVVEDPVWCSHADLLLIRVVNGDLVRPPSLVLADRETFATVVSGLGGAGARAAWEAPLRAGLTLTDTEALVDTLACGGGRASALEWCVDGQPEVPRAVGGFRRDPIPARTGTEFVQRFLRSSLPFVNARARSTQASVAGGTWPVAALAAVAGVGLVGAAAGLWCDRRRRDLSLLGVRGVSPAAIGVKVALELSVPVLAGAALGVAGARVAVGALGPSPAIEASATAQGAVAGLAAVVLGAATSALVAAARVREGRRRRRVPLGVLPWELGLLVATVASSRRLGRWGVPIGRGAEVTRADALGLLFPVLFLVTSVAVLARSTAVVLPRLRRRSGGGAVWMQLALARLAHQRTAAVGLLAAAATATGVLGYAATMDRSLDATLAAKAATYVGSDLAVVVPAPADVPDELAATLVVAHEQAAADIDGERQSVAVRAIDPATFASGAFWEPSYADRSLATVLHRLRAPAGGGPVPAVVVGGGTDAAPGQVIDLVISGSGRHRLQVRPVPGVRAFPGMSRPRPTVFLDAAVLAEAPLRGRQEVWIRGDPTTTAAALRSAGVVHQPVRSVGDVVDRSAFVTVSWTFGFLRWLGIAAGALVVGGLAVHLDARHRARVLGYAFLRRMGMSSAEHGRAVLAELVATVVVGAWLGLAVALAAADLAHADIDPVPGYEPAPLLRPAIAVVTVAALASAGVAVAAARLAQRRLQRDDAVAVLRAGA